MAEENRLAARVLELRAQKDLSQRQLALAAGLTPPTIANLESGRSTPSERTIHRIANVLGVPAEELLELTDTGHLPLAKFRKAAGLSQQRLAELAGISEPTVWAIESGNSRGSIETLQAISEVLDISLEELAGKRPRRASGARTGAEGRAKRKPLKFEVYRHKSARDTEAPMLALGKDGIRLNIMSAKALGNPRFVELLYDQESKAVGVRALEEQEPHAYTINRHTKDKVISCRSFLNYYGIRPESPIHRKAQLIDGVLVAYLDQAGN